MGGRPSNEEEDMGDNVELSSAVSDALLWISIT